MKTTIDSAGRLVIPKAIRRQAGLEPGMSLDVRCKDGLIEIEPAIERVKLVWQGRLLVAVPETPRAPLTAAQVEAVSEELLLERERSILGEP